MTAPGAPAIAGGVPVREAPLPYGRHELTAADKIAVAKALDAGSLTGGGLVTQFEARLAATGGAKHAVAVCNGTAALHLAVAALGLGAGDDVVTTPLTFVATANAVRFVGARPVFADIGTDRCLDPGAVAALLSENSRAVISVDYSGMPADIEALRASVPAGVPVISDSAHSLGGSLRGRPVGALADITTLSFHPVKSITTGEGGACLTDDDGLASRLRSLRSHDMSSTAEERSGFAWRYDVAGLGFNYRLTDFQAALGLSQISRLGAIVERRSELAARYDELLRDIPGLVLPPRPPKRTSAWHLYAAEVVEAEFGCRRDAVIDGLRAENIQATLHYPAAHLLTAYRNLGHQPGEAPRAELACSRLVTLPLFAAMSDADQDDVVLAMNRLSNWHRSSSSTTS